MLQNELSLAGGLSNVVGEEPGVANSANDWFPKSFKAFETLNLSIAEIRDFSSKY